jgi:hypothetical protein
LDIADGINDCAGRLAAAAEEVGDADGIAMQELAEDHGLALLAKSGYKNMQSIC